MKAALLPIYMSLVLVLTTGCETLNEFIEADRRKHQQQMAEVLWSNSRPNRTFQDIVGDMEATEVAPPEPLVVPVIILY